MNTVQKDLLEKVEQIKKGGAEKYHQKNKAAGKLFARERLELLFDEGVMAEDGLFANHSAEDLPCLLYTSPSPRD